MSDITRAQEKLDVLQGLDNKALLERAWNEIKALCGSSGRPKRWTMTVPVDADRDSDVLFSEVLKRFAQLEAKIEGLMTAIRVIADSKDGATIAYGILQNEENPTD